MNRKIFLLFFLISGAHAWTCVKFDFNICNKGFTEAACFNPGAAPSLLNVGYGTNNFQSVEIKEGSTQIKFYGCNDKCYLTIDLKVDDYDDDDPHQISGNYKCDDSNYSNNPTVSTQVKYRGDHPSLEYLPSASVVYKYCKEGLNINNNEKLSSKINGISDCITQLVNKPGLGQFSSLISIDSDAPYRNYAAVLYDDDDDVQMTKALINTTFHYLSYQSKYYKAFDVAFDSVSAKFKKMYEDLTPPACPPKSTINVQDLLYAVALIIGPLDRKLFVAPLMNIKGGDNLGYKMQTFISGSISNVARKVKAASLKKVSLKEMGSYGPETINDMKTSFYDSAISFLTGGEYEDLSVLDSFTFYDDTVDTVVELGDQLQPRLKAHFASHILNNFNVLKCTDNDRLNQVCNSKEINCECNDELIPGCRFQGGIFENYCGVTNENLFNLKEYSVNGDLSNPCNNVGGWDLTSGPCKLRVKCKSSAAVNVNLTSDE
ncbi:hypothetical protein Glove_94g42 [Diversispora epigaea]|uniref:Sushi domain-containing protein n=1 Tax=Diversispora epigaea TaxID=1348612 RepID=A0A397JDZ1_9GLOM|nr:hypothetical protein Glove_94g42 [Diversispora epigaea]